MDLFKLLKSKRDGIVSAWREAALATYPPDVTRFLAKQKNPFANPVGATLSEGLAGIVDVLLEKKGGEDLTPFLDDIMRMRAVQSFTPGQAVGFLFDLKDILRGELKKAGKDPQLSSQWTKVDQRIDAMAVAGFDAYQASRERLHEIRVQEVKNLSYAAMKRANLVCDLEELPEGAGAWETESGK